jgi:hypothetical protein
VSLTLLDPQVARKRHGEYEMLRFPRPFLHGAYRDRTGDLRLAKEARRISGRDVT